MAVHPLRVLSICSGVGGLDLGIRLAIPTSRTVCYVEREAFCVEVLASRMEEGALDPAPVWSDLRTFDGRPWRGVVDLITGGYPCQPFSLAGARRGADDPRHLWPEFSRLIGEIRPPFVFLENVAGHLSLGLEEVLHDLEGMDYRAACGLFTAEEVGAPHRRERLFVLAISNAECCGHGRWSEESLRESVERASIERHRSDVAHTVGAELRDEPRRSGGPNGSDSPEPEHVGADVADGHCGRCSRVGCKGLFDGIGSTHRNDAHGCSRPHSFPPGPSGDWSAVPEEAQPAIRGGADGSSYRMDRLRALGNGVVPQQAALALRVLAGVLFA